LYQHLSYIEKKIITTGGLDGLRVYGIRHVRLAVVEVLRHLVDQFTELDVHHHLLQRDVLRRPALDKLLEKVQLLDLLLLLQLVVNLALVYDDDYVADMLLLAAQNFF